MTLAHHCDRDGCDTWQRTKTSFPPFLTVTDGAEVLGHFCCLDCLLHWAAACSEPTEVIPL